jgi:hypothetical protein
MENPTKLFGLVAAALAAVTGLYTIVTFTHDKIQQVDELEKKIEHQANDIKEVRGNVIIDEIKTDIRILKGRIYKIEERYGEDIFDAPGLVREEYKNDKDEIDAMQQELKATQRAYKALR